MARSKYGSPHPWHGTPSTNSSHPSQSPAVQVTPSRAGSRRGSGESGRASRARTSWAGVASPNHGALRASTRRRCRLASGGAPASSAASSSSCSRSRRVHASNSSGLVSRTLRLSASCRTARARCWFRSSGVGSGPGASRAAATRCARVSTGARSPAGVSAWSSSTATARTSSCHD